jgi:hypothetical protein
MKKKTLTEEINRMLILMESPANKWVVAAQELAKILKEIPGFTGLKYIDKLKVVVTPEDVIKLLNEMSIYSTKLNKVVLETIYKNLPPEVTNTVSQLIETIKEGLDAGRSRVEINKLIDDTIKTLDSKVDDIEVDLLKLVKDDIVKQVDEYIPKKVPDTPTPPPLPTPKDMDSLTNLIERVNSFRPGSISIKDRALLLKNFPFRESRAKINRLINENMLKGQYLENKIAELLKKAADDLILKNEVKPLLYRTISAEIEAYRASEDVLMGRLYTILEEALTVGLGGGTKAGQDASTIVAKIKEHDALIPNAPSYFDDLMANTYLGKIADWRKAGWKKNIINGLFRSLSFSLTGQLRTLSEFVGEFLMNKSSRIKKIGVIWFYFTAMTKILVPAVLGIFQTLWNGIKMSSPLEEKEGALWEQYKGLMAEKLKESFIAFDEEVTKEGAKILNPLNPDEQIDEVGTFLKILNPFEFYGDEVLDAMNSIAGGFTTESINQFIDRILKRVRGDIEQRTDVVLDRSQNIYDSLQKTIDSLQNINVPIRNIDTIPVRVDTLRRGEPITSPPSSGN